MLKNFEELKSELRELSTIINSFKSEQVQVRLVELLFESEARDPQKPIAESQLPARQRKRRKGQGALAQSDRAGPDRPAKQRRSNGSGPAATLDALINEGFFAKRQSLIQVIHHCKNNKARTFKQSDLSGLLGKLVRDGKLKREKNKDHQFEYWKV